jgi:hypothetical protein
MGYIDTLQCVNNRIKFQQRYKCAVKLCSIYFINIIMVNVTSAHLLSIVCSRQLQMSEIFTSRVKRA